MNNLKNIESHRLSNNWAYAVEYWKKKKVQYNHELNRWTMKYDHSLEHLGMCSYRECTIYISTVIMRAANCNYAKVRKILLHEIAHVLAPGDDHGPEWKGKCKLIGADDSVKMSMNMPGMNWSLYCHSCKWRTETLPKPHPRAGCPHCRKLLRVKPIK